MTRNEIKWALVLLHCGCFALMGCSESSSSDDDPKEGEGGAFNEEPVVDPCGTFAADECESDDSCKLQTTFDCKAWEDVSYCVSKDAECESGSSTRGVALETSADLKAGQCYEFESRCYTGSFRSPREAECEVCDF